MKKGGRSPPLSVYFLLGSGEVSEEAGSFLVFRHQTVLNEDMLFLAITRLREVFGTEVTQICDAPVVHVEEPSVTGALEAVRHNF